MARTSFTRVMQECTEYGIAVRQTKQGFSFLREGQHEVICHMYPVDNQWRARITDEYADQLGGLPKSYTGSKGNAAGWCLDIAANI